MLTMRRNDTIGTHSEADNLGELLADMHPAR